MIGGRSRTGWRIAMVGGLLLGSLAAWAQPPTPGGTLRVAVDADVPGLDPHRVPGTAALRLLGNLFNSLRTLDAAGNPVPDLAESWDILEDGLVYVFHLRRGVTFPYGTAWRRPGSTPPEPRRWGVRRARDRKGSCQTDTRATPLSGVIMGGDRGMVAGTASWETDITAQSAP
jgi:hypothetical protein